MSDAFFDDEIRNELKDLLPIQELVEMDRHLCEQIKEMIPGLASAHAGGDWQEVYRVTHKLAGASEMLGLNSFAKALRAQEQAALAESPGDLIALREQAEKTLVILAH